MRSLFAIIAAAAIITACGSSVPEGTTLIEVDNAKIVKPAEGRDITGGTLTVSVVGSDLSLVSAQTDIAERVEFHTMSMDDGKMSMRQVEAFDVAPDGPLVLERGGDHLMFFGLDPAIDVGAEVDIALTFEDGEGGTQIVVTKAEVVGQGG